MEPQKLIYLGCLLEEEQPTRRWKGFDGDEAIATIASPGAGKSAAMAIPNLITWGMPALVLDIKGELYDQTAGCRSHYGEVYRFNPDAPDGHAFNPFAFVDPNDKKNLWVDCQFLADQMVIPSDKGDPFWQDSARDLLVTILAGLFLDTRREESVNFELILDALANRDDLDRIATVLGMSDIRSAKRASFTLCELMRQEQESQSKLLQSFCLQAKSYLSHLTGDHILHATRRCDWQPEDLRDENATVYLDLRSSDIEHYRPLIRMILAIHYRQLTKAMPDEDTPPILFMLDEMPQLGYMKVIENMLDVGRGYKLKLWCFAQNKGQLEKAYGDANGFLSKCAVRAYMNPAGADADNLAQTLSDAFGKVESLRTEQQRALFEAFELAGSRFRDRVIVFERGKEPLILGKAFARDNPTIAERLDWEVQEWVEDDDEDGDGIHLGISANDEVQ